MKNPLRVNLLDRRLTIGGWIQIGHPACAEVLAGAGFDWLCVDLEHGAIDLETTANIFRAIDAFDCVPVARLPANDPVWIHRVLDAGARGLIIPMVNSAEEAEAAVKQAKYPPRGVRGYGYSRANRHGMAFKESIGEANDEIAMIMQIEHHRAIDALDDILSVDGVDGLFIGPLDLSGSMGITGQLDHPRMQEAMCAFRDACQRHGKAAGFHVVRPTQPAIATALGQKYSLVALGLDNVFMEMAGSAAIQTCREFQQKRGLKKLAA
ncbi:MAG: aldolase/citrate lyase family protein [Verrucomicrobiae bacterium]|nr:aldolase/citrate lyase family protein [Verrucomicrobiae bacterium]